MTREEMLKWLEQIEKDIYVCSLESTFADDAKSCAIHEAIQVLSAELREDYISRQVVIDVLQPYIDANKDSSDLYLSGCGDGAYHALCKIKSLPPVHIRSKGEWIPVSERLPEKRGMYIVTEKVFSLDDREHTGRFNRMTEQVEFCNGKWQRARFYEVIAWMPLPEPYKEGEE